MISRAGIIFLGALNKQLIMHKTKMNPGQDAHRSKISSQHQKPAEEAGSEKIEEKRPVDEGMKSQNEPERRFKDWRTSDIGLPL
jgi:hypothetical protein